MNRIFFVLAFTFALVTASPAKAQDDFLYCDRSPAEIQQFAGWYGVNASSCDVVRAFFATDTGLRPGASWAEVRQAEIRRFQLASNADWKQIIWAHIHFVERVAPMMDLPAGSTWGDVVRFIRTEIGLADGENYQQFAMRAAQAFRVDPRSFTSVSDVRMALAVPVDMPPDARWSDLRRAHARLLGLAEDTTWKGIVEFRLAHAHR